MSRLGQARDLLRKVGRSNIVRLVVLVAAFAWFPLHGTEWFAMNDPDVWWHMRSGEWILQHHALPHTDPFSITGAGRPWVAYSWVFGVLIDLVAKAWDLRGIAAFTVISWTILTATLLWLVRRVLKSFWPSVLLAFLGGLVMQRVVAPRPGNFSIFFFMVVLGILVTSENRPFPQNGKDRAPGDIPHNQRTVVWGTLLILVMWLWANTHLQFVYGLALIGAFALARRRAWLWITLGLSTLVTAATPYGIGAWEVIWDFLHQPRQYDVISEFHSMAFNRPVHYVVAFLTLGAAMCLGKMRRRAAVWMLLLIFGVVQGFRMERDIWVVSIIAIMTIATWMAGWAVRPSDSRRGAGATSMPDAAGWLWGVVAGCVVVVIAYAIATGPSNKELLGRVADSYPLAASAYIREHHLPGPIFNNFDWGGFLIYALPDYPVTIDGRTNVHGQDELIPSQDTWNLMPGWKANPLLARAHLVIASPDFALTQALEIDPGFKVVFRDRTAVVFERK